MLRHIWVGVIALVVATVASADEKHDHKGGGKHAGLEKLKKLAGTWVAVGEDGKPTDTVVSVFKVTAGGSAVHETIFPGQPHEMITVYFTDGKDLLLSHYCAAGNQPKMKLDPKSKNDDFKFVFAGGTNFDPAKDLHMHEGSIKILDENHIQWDWVAYMDGKPTKDHHVSLKLVRKNK